MDRDVSQDLGEFSSDLAAVGGYSSTAEDIDFTLSLSDLDLRDLIDLVNDPELISMILDLYSRDQISSSDIGSLLDRLDTLYGSGRIDYKQYMAALELLKRLAESRGMDDLAYSIDSKMLQTFKDRTEIESLLKGLSSLKDLGFEGFDSQEISGGGPQLELEGFNIDSLPEPLQNQGIGGFSGFQLPDLSRVSTIFLSSSVRDAVIYIAVALALILLLVYFTRIQRLIGSSIRGTSSIFRGYYSLPKDIDQSIVRRYWNMVRRLSRKIPISDSETHREYLDKVSKSLGEVPEFKDLTYMYERVRFGHRSVEDKRSGGV